MKAETMNPKRNACIGASKMPTAAGKSDEAIIETGEIIQTSNLEILTRE